MESVLYFLLMDWSFIMLPLLLPVLDVHAMETQNVLFFTGTRQECEEKIIKKLREGSFFQAQKMLSCFLNVNTPFFQVCTKDVFPQRHDSSFKMLWFCILLFFDF